MHASIWRWPCSGSLIRQGLWRFLDDLAGRAPAFAEQYALRGEILRAEKQHEAAAAAFPERLNLA